MFLPCSVSLLILVKFITTIGNCMCSCFLKDFNAVNTFKDSVILDLMLWSKSGNGSRSECANECGWDKQCVSFFYNQQTYVCTGHTIHFYSAEQSIEDFGSLYYTLAINKRDCTEIRSLHPMSPDGVYIINPDDGKGPARVYCDMSISGWTVVKDCADILNYDSDTPDGIYIVNPPDGVGHFRVYCDMTTEGGGWTVFQRRQDGSVDFYRYWDDYKTGFGQVDAEFWLGNDNINRLTSQGSYQLRIDMKDQADESGYATYSTFLLADEANNYRLTAAGFNGDRGDSLSYHNGRMFSTRLQDHDTYRGGNCADVHRSAWWFGYCTKSNLNGVYNETEYADGIVWYYWHGPTVSLKWVEMKLKPAL